ncbi:MAG: hypothetical protein M3Z00_04425, partial [Actinomycetota bacterium]|nr:hypothetical protein [Actinomycetota bacterium]
MSSPSSSAKVPEFGPNDWFVEEKYQQYLADPASVDASWQEYFAELGSSAAAAEGGSIDPASNGPASNGPASNGLASNGRPVAPTATGGAAQPASPPPPPPPPTRAPTAP